MTTVSARTAKYEVVAERIEQSLCRAAPGTKLPSLRALMERYRASQATIDRSLSLLINRGLLEHVPEKGVFIPSDRPADGRSAHVELCFFYEKSSLSQNIFYSQTVSRMMTVANDVNIRMHVSAYDEMGSLDQFQQMVERIRPDAMVLMSVTRVNFELLLRSMNIPTLLLLPNAVQSQSNRVIIDDVNGITAIVDHLRGLGHERIAYLHGQGFHGFYNRTQGARIDAFYDVMRDRGLAVPAHFVEYGGFTTDEGHAAASKLLNHPQRPTAIIGNDYNFAGVYQAIEALGLAVGRDISVVGFDNMFPAEVANPSLTTVDIHWERIADVTVQALNDLLKDPSITGREHLTPTDLVVRHSTGEAR